MGPMARLPLYLFAVVEIGAGVWRLSKGDGKVGTAFIVVGLFIGLGMLLSPKAPPHDIE